MTEQPIVTEQPTPGQTVGPFFHLGLPYPGDNELAPPGHPAAIRLHGVVLDGAGDAVPDAMIELWQTAPDGSVPAQPGSLARNGWDFTGFGRAATDRAGHYSFTTLTPGAPRYFALTVFARGLLDRLYTRAYLDPPEGRLASLAATPDGSGYRFDLVLQGPDQTPFLALGTA